MFLIRGIEFSYQTVRDWETKLTPTLSDIAVVFNRRGQRAKTLDRGRGRATVIVSLCNVPSASVISLPVPTVSDAAVASMPAATETVTAVVGSISASSVEVGRAPRTQSAASVQAPLPPVHWSTLGVGGAEAFAVRFEGWVAIVDLLVCSPHQGIPRPSRPASPAEVTSPVAGGQLTRSAGSAERRRR